MSDYDYKAVDAVVNIWNEEALKQRPGWGDDFFQKKMNSKSSMSDPIEIDQLMEILDDAGIDKAFLIAILQPCSKWMAINIYWTVCETLDFEED